MLEDPADTAPVRNPVCPSCNKPMQLQTGTPHQHYVNLRRMMFVCDCGSTTEQLIADLPSGSSLEPSSPRER